MSRFCATPNGRGRGTLSGRLLQSFPSPRDIALWATLHLTLLLGTASADAAEAPFLLEIEGTPLGSYSLRCVFVEGGREYQYKDRGWISKSYEFHADALSCRISMLDARARLAVVLSRGESLIAFGEQNALFGSLEVRSSGPWGGAGSKKSGGKLRLVPRH